MAIQKTDLTEKIEKLRALEAEAVRLQAQILDQRPAELASLHAVYGFADVADFIKAVKEAAAKAPARKKAGKAAAQKPAKKAGKPGRPKKAAAPKLEKKPRGRARITDEVRAQVKALVAEGKSGSQISKLLKISMPSVQNIKKEAGLVKARSRRSKAEKPALEAAAPVAAPVAPVAPVADAPVPPADASAN